jgi:radical SAM-linked protein
VDKVFRSLRATGYEDASLFSLSVSDYPYLGETVGRLMDSLEKDHVALSLSSLRPRGLSSEIARNITRVRKTGFTLVPEAGSERLRRVINKDLTDEDVREAAANAFREGWKLIKLYFMIGLPTETGADIEEIVRFVDRLTDLGRGILGSPPRINVSVSSFIPKPHTPFQWSAMDDEATLREKQAFLRGSFRRQRHVQIKDHPVESSLLEGVFARGDRRLGPVLRKAWEGGARFDSWKDGFRAQVWNDAFAAAGVDRAEYLGPLPTEAVLPWDHIRTGVRKAFLREELERALRAEPTPSCLDAACALCGGCEFPASFERGYGATIDVAEPDHAPLGRKTDAVRRYLAVYAKQGPARFFGHNDLLNVLQRSFKRARVEVLYSEGFHPKMLMSFVPALPLGMEGREEAFEFRTAFDFDEAEFVEALNRSVPPGIVFTRLERVAPGSPKLNDRLAAMTYGLDLGADEVRAALAERRGERDLPASDADAVEQLAAAELDPLLADFRVDRRSGRLAFTIAHTNAKPLRPQDVIEKILGLKKSVYLLVRERIVYK